MLQQSEHSASQMLRRERRWQANTTLSFPERRPHGFDAGDGNLYRYVGNSPTNAVDPDGLMEQKANERITPLGYAEVTFDNRSDGAVWWSERIGDSANRARRIGRISGDVDLTHHWYFGARVQRVGPQAIVLSDEYGGFGVSQAMLNNAATGASSYWRQLRSAGLTLSADQYDRSIKFFLAASRDGHEFGRRLQFTTSAANRNVEELRDFAIDNPELAGGLPLLDTQRAPRSPGEVRPLLTPEAAQAQHVADVLHDQGVLAAWAMPGGIGEMAIHTAGGFAGTGINGRRPSFAKPPAHRQVAQGEQTNILIVQLRLNRSKFTAAEQQAIDYKYTSANRLLGTGSESAVIGNKVEYSSHASRRFVRNTFHPDKAIRDVKIPKGFQVDEFVSRQFGGRQVQSNQWLMPNETNLNNRLGPLEQHTTKDLRPGTTIVRWKVVWIND